MWFKYLFRVVFALLFIAAGINHFWHPANYLLIMPPYLAHHQFLNLAAGVLEVLGGIFLLHPNTRQWGGWLIITLLFFFLPVHIYMIQKGGCMGPSLCVSLWLVWLRLPLQFVLIAWAWWVSRPRQPAKKN